MNKKFLTFPVMIFSLILFTCSNPVTNYFKNRTKVSDDKYSFEDKKIILSDLQKQLHMIGKEGAETVVFISTEKVITEKYSDPFDFFFQSPWGGMQKPQERKFKQNGLGSGVIFKKKGNTYFIITNNHVIDQADSIKVTINEKKTYKAEVAGKDPSVDIAVLKIKTFDELNTARFGNSDKVEIGDFTAALGNPFGLNNTMTFGIISATGRSNVSGESVSLTNFIQTDASINPGNSGGALINMAGEVIGINTLIYSQTGGSVGIGFAVPSNIAVRSAEQLITRGHADHGFLGVIFKELTDDDIKSLGLKEITGGMLVTQVIEKSPAEKYGIKTGDVIVEINGKKIETQNDFIIIIGSFAPDAKISLKIMRNNQLILLDAVLGKRS